MFLFLWTRAVTASIPRPSTAAGYGYGATGRTRLQFYFLRFLLALRLSGGSAFEEVGFHPVPVENQVNCGNGGQKKSAVFVQNFERFTRKRPPKDAA